MAAYLPLGEPADSLDAPQLADELEASGHAVARWWRKTRGAGLDVEVVTFWGTHTVQKVLSDTTFSLAQHTRQLMTLLLDLGSGDNGKPAIYGEERRAPSDLARVGSAPVTGW